MQQGAFFAVDWWKPGILIQSSNPGSACFTKWLLWLMYATTHRTAAGNLNGTTGGIDPPSGYSKSENRIVGKEIRSL
jgi:hypothetical protein